MGEKRPEGKAALLWLRRSGPDMRPAEPMLASRTFWKKMKRRNRHRSLRNVK